MKAILLDYWELTKPGVTFMVLISTFGGFYLGASESIQVVLLLNTLLGTWLVAAGTNAFNQLIESQLDTRMKRTHKRPLPAGRLQPKPVQLFAAVISVAGLMILALAVNLLTAALAALTLCIYIAVYTPMKRKTSLSTILGAVPGALPAMGGWAAVRGEVSVEAWVLFAILFFWQMPHFLAIAWLYREDYARGGFLVLPVLDKGGFHTGLYVISNCLALLTVSLLPTLMGMTGGVYFVGALIMGIGFLISGFRLTLKTSNRYAKQLLHASIIYLPILIALMALDKSRF
ncbi:MAG: heme o synthase [bacterium]